MRDVPQLMLCHVNFHNLLLLRGRHDGSELPRCGQKAASNCLYVMRCPLVLLLVLLVLLVSLQV